MTGPRDEQLRLLQAQVEDLYGLLAAAETTRFRPVDWRSLDRERAAAEWDRLAGFVSWLRGRYGLAESVPACWFEHPAISEELSALHAAWLGSYLDPAAPADAGVAWHDGLDRVRMRIRDWDRTGCAAGAHRADEPAAEDAAARERWRAFIEADLAGRPASTAEPASSGSGAAHHADGQYPPLRGV